MEKQPPQFSPQGQALIDKIEEVIYSSREQSLPLAHQLQTIENDSLSNIMGEYYLRLINFQTISSEENLEKLFAIYPELKKNKLYSYLYFIDRMAMYRYYYAGQYDLVKERLEELNGYIFEPELEAYRTALLYGMSPLEEVNKEEKQEIISTLENIGTKNWTLIHYELYRILGEIYINEGNISEAKSTWLYAINREIDKGRFIQAAQIYNDLSYFEENYELGLIYSQKAIDLMNQTGYNIYQNVFWRLVGHQNMNLNNIEKAPAAYDRAIQYGVINHDTIAMALDYGYAGWAYFKSDTLHNFDIANQYFEKAFSITDTLSLPYSNALKRKSWMLESVGRENEIKNVIALLGEYEQFLCSNSINEFWLKNNLTLRTKNKKINTLNRENQLKTKKLKNRRVFLYFAVGLSMITIVLLLLFRQRSLFMRQLNQKKDHLEQTNLALQQKNEIIESQNSELVESKLKIQEELKKKITLLSSNVNTFERITEMISKSNKISMRDKKELFSVLDSDFTKQIIEDIEHQFQHINSDFIQNLLEKHSDLTTNNVKLCTYLKMGLSSKEIASLTYTNTSSVKVARSRLRKKLNLEDDEKLFTYLNSL